jgi:hypothetical protein
MLKLYKSGRHVDPLNLRPIDLDIRDIAHNLSLLCRYTGAFPFHYSVAQHSLLVAQMMEVDGHPPNTVLAGLLHDGAEYVFGDVNYHLKRLPELAEYNRREHECSKMIVAHFGSTIHELEKVKPYDREAAHFEMAVRDSKSFEVPIIFPIVPHAPKTIYHRFMMKFGQLTGNDPYDYSSFHLPSNI